MMKIKGSVTINRYFCSSYSSTPVFHLLFLYWFFWEGFVMSISKIVSFKMVLRASLVTQMVKNSPGRPGFDPWVGKIPGREHGNPLHILAWRIPRTEEPGRLQSVESQRVRHDGAIEHKVVP